MNKGKKLTKPQVYSTIIVLSAAMLALHFLFKLRYFDSAALVLLLLATIFYSAAYWIAWVWLRFAELIGNINSKIILSAIFFLFLFPVALLYRLSKKDTMQLKKKSSSSKSYFHERNHQYTSGDLSKTW